MKQRNGVWQTDFRLSNGERVRKSLDTRDKATATRKERELQVMMEAALQGRAIAPPSTPAGPLTAAVVRAEVLGHGMTIKAAYKRCKREHEAWRASSSPKTIDDNYGHIIRYFGEDRDLITLNRDVMFEYVEQLRDVEELAASTINQRLSFISVLMTYAEDWTNRAVKVFKMPRQKVRNGRIRILSYDEEFKVLRWLIHESPRKRGKDADFAELVKFLVDTGFRLSEALRVQSHEVDWDNGLVMAWETKADLPRQVPMTKRVREILEERADMERPFEMFTVDSADDHWEIMRKGLKIDTEKDPEFVIHALRHTCASRLAASGMDAFKIQKWMGHKDIKTTQKYVTLFGADLHDLASALDSRRTAAALKVPFGGRVTVPRLVPKSVPKRPHASPARTQGGQPGRLVPQGNRPIQRTEASVDEGLLIRRSLVRAQVGEPLSSETPSEVPTNTLLECDQECDQN